MGKFIENGGCQGLGGGVNKELVFNRYKVSQDKKGSGSSLVVQWLRLHASTSGDRVRSLVGEVRSCMPQGAAKKKEFWRWMVVVVAQECEWT